MSPTPNGPIGVAGTGVATISDEGTINTVLFHFQLDGDDVSVGFTYSGLNSGISVEPPPADRIVPHPAIQSCPPSGSPLDGGSFCAAASPSS